MAKKGRSLFAIAYEAGANVKKNRVLKFSSGKTVHTTADTDIPAGFSDEDTDSGKMVTAHQMGTVIVTASGSIAQGAEVAPDADGKVKTWATGDTKLGVALEAASADGDEIEMRKH